ncbi:putative sporulation protein YtxC [Crassaminicella indica]|uniref:Sporulation protein YtxC n=1 Tax=Crassaminicella indica TaxID=2855394 RepID=A0ABX8RC32_9CLOT|nr:putative sporulation protein YtxC [Crassaminicella indica]QXM06361.1 putative sporulation protein YtxC [Crassaminicella indica]
MTLLTLILNAGWEDICNRLNRETDFFLKDGIVIDRNIEKVGKEIYITYSVKELNTKKYTADDFKYIFKYYMANIFSEIIINNIEERLAYKILSSQYFYFGLQERKAILKHFNNIQKDEMYQYEEGVLCTISKKAKIVQQMMNYFMENDAIHMEGFIRFRLRSYTEELENNIDRAVEDFIMEKEYNEFIRLLRYFVDIQEAKIDTVHVLMSENGNYHLYDSKNRMINNEYLEDLALEMADKDISCDDLLISSLITLAPKKVGIHFSANGPRKEIVETIQKVFSDRVYICSGCNLCGSVKNIKQE